MTEDETIMEIRSMEEMTDRGKVKIQVLTKNRNRPVENAKVRISFRGNPDTVLEEVVTDANGQTEYLEFPTPPLEYSMSPSERQPYSEYNVQILADGFEPLEITGTQLFSGEKSTQKAAMIALDQEGFQTVVIPENTLYGDYPEKIPEKEIKPIDDSGEIVLSRVVIPEYIIVHNGAPSDSTAEDYYVRYRDYIKNVASSEIYATWPTETIKANILAIMSFTLNRVYTEWYRNKGYDFTITSSTAFDHKWIYGRNIFQSISEVVDEIFEDYLSRPDVKQPILTQYCDGKKVQCPKWMSQWGSKYLGEQNYKAIEILRNYYGEDIYINSAEEISGIPSSWPGYNLDIGSSGAKVQQMQDQLNMIGKVYTSIPYIAVDGIYGEKTKEAVKKFQSVFGLNQSGIVDYRTWYKIQEIYVGVTRIAELY